jgi:hypothetical protein
MASMARRLLSDSIFALFCAPAFLPIAAAAGFLPFFLWRAGTIVDPAAGDNHI